MNTTSALFLPAVEVPPPFPSYGVEDVGTVIAHEGPHYIVKMLDGRVCAFRSNSGTPSEADAAADIASPAPEPVAVPASVTRRQLKEQLIRMDRLHEVEATVSAITGTDGRIARNWWAEAVEFRRDHPLVGSLGGALNLSEAEIDAAFIAAAAL